jgi:MinD-like ATPase involved in chromosome partitioning or flagellar assembly
MDRKPYLIMVGSQKGGVGKTTVAINLAVALARQDYRVILVDADTSTFSINEHLGIKAGGNGFVEAVEGKIPINETIFAYQPIDLHIILGSDTNEVFKPDPEDLAKFYAQLVKMDYDFIVVDLAPGLFDTNYAKFINDVIIVTTPDSPAATSNAKLAAFCAKLKINYRLVINKSGNHKFELEKSDVEKLFGDVAYGTLPDDRMVSEGLMRHMPAYLMDNGSPFPVAIEELARVYMLKVGDPVTEKGNWKGSRKGFFRKFADWGIGPKYKN